MAYAGDVDTLFYKNALNDHAWAVSNLDKDIGLTTGPLSKTFTRKRSITDLRISTLSQPDLHDRYNSSEEEPSPSPDSETGSQFDDEVDGETEIVGPDDVALMEEGNDIDEDAKQSAIGHEDTQPEFAVAVPIMAMGRPKLVDISSLAPMHKRKRSDDSQNTITRIPSGARAVTATKPVESIFQRKQSSLVSQPTCWLPESDEMESEQRNNDDGAESESADYLDDLKLQVPPTYSDYDPYSLNPPKLSPRNSFGTPSKKPGSVARARKQVSQPIIFEKAPSLRNLRRSLHGGKQQDTATSPKQLSKKPKMLARGATERTAMPFIPQ